MNLTAEQQLLLHAYADGACNGPDAARARELLESPKTARAAQAYLEEVGRLREMVRDCANTRAPEGLHGRVRRAVRDESKKVSPANWGVWFAAAAGVLIAVGVAVASDAFDQAPEVPHIPTVADVPTQPAPRKSAPSFLVFPEERDATVVEVSARREKPFAVLHMDGTAEPVELNVEYNRARESGVAAAYDDLAELASRYGRVHRLTGNPDPGFPGHDFAQCGGVRVLVTPANFTRLMAALQTLDEGLGTMLTPAEMAPRPLPETVVIIKLR